MDSESFATSASNKQISTVANQSPDDIMLAVYEYMSDPLPCQVVRLFSPSALIICMFSLSVFGVLTKMIELTALIQLQHAAALELVAITTGAGGQCPKLTGRW